jgi:hypothetical protein
MAVTHTWTSRISVPGLPTLPAEPNLVIAGDEGIEMEFTVAAVTTDFPVALPSGTIDKTKIISMVLNATGACTVETNAVDHAGGQIFTLAAGRSFAWNDLMDADSFPNPITQDIDSFYITNAGSAAITCRFGFLLTVA